MAIGRVSYSYSQRTRCASRSVSFRWVLIWISALFTLALLRFKQNGEQIPSSNVAPWKGDEQALQVAPWEEDVEVLHLVSSQASLDSSEIPHEMVELRSPPVSPRLASSLSVLEDSTWASSRRLGIHTESLTPSPSPSPPPLPQKKEHSPSLPAIPELLYDLKKNCRQMEQNKQGGTTDRDDACMGVGPGHITQCPDNRVQMLFHDPGYQVGGPTGCKEAWATVLADVSFLPGVLVLLHSVRKYAQDGRDFVVLVSLDLPRQIVRFLESQCVVVRYADPGHGQQARELRKKSERYRTGYWVIKMFLWRSHEYTKLLYLDGDIFVRQSPDRLFCVEVSDRVPLVAAPRSAKRPEAGFNAGTFLLSPNQSRFDDLLALFAATPLRDLLASNEQQFLNEAFQGRYRLFPADAIQKHRRWINEEPLWNISRIVGFHMNGPPKPWEPQWLTPCAYPKSHRRKAHLYARFFGWWWELYYEMLGKPLPDKVSEYRLHSDHDLLNMWQNWDEAAFRSSCRGRRLW